jgi:hypothetical protein
MTAAAPDGELTGATPGKISRARKKREKHQKKE